MPSFFNRLFPGLMEQSQTVGGLGMPQQQPPQGLGAQQQPMPQQMPEQGGFGGQQLQDLAAVFGPMLMAPRAQRGQVLAQGASTFGERRQKSLMQNATAQFLLKKGIAKDPQEAMLFAQQPELIQFVMKSKGNLINAGDGNLYNPETQEWIKAPGGSAKAPQIVELFDEKSGQPYKAVWDDSSGEYKRLGGVKARSGMSFRTNADGTIEMIQGDLSSLPKLTDAEGKSAGFLERGRKSNSVISKLEGQGTSLFNATIGQLPVAGNYLRSQDAQKYDQAQRDFVNAVLRRESGAVISPQEFDNAKQQYFPQPGDGPEVIAQKRANREAALRGFEISAGQGAGLVTPAPGASDGAPQPGAVEDGYRFKGGDPADPNNWEPAQ